MNLNVFEILVLVSLIQGILFSFIILTQKSFKVKANKYLAYGTLILSYIGITELLAVKKLHDKYYIIKYFIEDVPWVLLVYIPMFIYFLKSTNHKLALSKKLVLLTIPFFIFGIFYTLILLHHEFKLIYWSFLQEKYRFIYESGFYFSFFFNTVLCILSFLIIKFSSISFNEKKWLYTIWSFHIILILLWIADNLIFTSTINPFNNKNIVYPIWLVASIYVYWLIFKGLIQLKLSQDKSEIKDLLENQKEGFNLSEKIDQKEINVNKKTNTKNVYFTVFLELMNKEKLYRNPDLSRDIVAEKLKISTGYLSQMISASVDSNFTSLINDYRIEEVKYMLLNTSFDKYSIIAIGLEAGFKSKSTFYSEFKKKTGYTPNQYKLLKNKS